MSDIKTLSIDIETYSGYDLSKCGVYKYVEHPDFDILLFGYTVNGGEVMVVDLACGEEIPDDVLSALSGSQLISPNSLPPYASQPAGHQSRRIWPCKTNLPEKVRRIEVKPRKSIGFPWLWCVLRISPPVMAK